MIWRADVVRLLPQTATFYKMVGLDVNLRGLAFKDIKITNETVDGKPVLVIEGVIVVDPQGATEEKIVLAAQGWRLLAGRRVGDRHWR